MSLTAVVTNHNYGVFLDECILSAERYADEILIYDDGSTDDHPSNRASTYRGHKVIHRAEATGSPVWGSNLGIEHATCTHLAFLDADNYWTGPPPQLDVDYCFAPIDIVDANGVYIETWQYPDWPLTAEGCFRRYKATGAIPFPWGGVWATSFLKGKKWRHWETTQAAADFRTAVDWVRDEPTLAYHPQSFLAFRTHPGQWSASPEIAQMQAEARAFAKEATWKSE